MAVGIAFPGANGVLRPPAGREDTVSPLAVHSTGEVVTTCWQLSPDEIAEIVLTGKVWLQVMGASMPPVWVRGENPFRK